MLRFSLGVRRGGCKLALYYLEALRGEELERIHAIHRYEVDALLARGQQAVLLRHNRHRVAHLKNKSMR